MTRSHRHGVRIATLAASLLPVLASAHHGASEASSFAAGALHPLGGADHLAGFLIVGVLAARLAGTHLAQLSAALLGLLVAAWTADTDGWRYAAGFTMSGAALVAAGAAATRLVRTIAGARSAASAFSR